MNENALRAALQEIIAEKLASVTEIKLDGGGPKVKLVEPVKRKAVVTIEIPMDYFSSQVDIPYIKKWVQSRAQLRMGSKFTVNVKHVVIKEDCDG